MNRNMAIAIIISGLSLMQSALAESSGKSTYDKACVTCHATGIAGAPRTGNSADWAPRVAAGGNARLYKSALQGTAKGMPPKGGRSDLSDADVKSAVDYMLPKADAKAAAKEAAKPAAKEEAKAAPAATPSPAAAAPAPAPAKAVAAAPAAIPMAGDVNSFNRLLKPVGKRNPAPAEDGIHDPASEGTLALQPPLQAYTGLPRSNAGNRIDWVAALSSKKITPRWDRVDAAADPVIMDLNIVREVKGSMPDVVYPHKQHTEWLDCSNCHPAIFLPQKGANQISMASIMLGEKCGVCHGKVAFPVSECRLCHSKKKDLAPKAAGPVSEAKP